MDICKQNPTFTSEEINKKLIIEYLKPEIFAKLNYKKAVDIVIMHLLE